MLTAEQVEFYKENGYLLVPGLLTQEEAAFYRAECHALIERLKKVRNVEATWGSARKLAGAAETQLHHCHDVQFYSAAFSRLIVHEKLMQATACLLGPNIQLHHTKMFIKPAEKGSPFPMHQDHPYFPHERHTMMAAILHFDDAPLEKGCVRVIPGSHKLGPIPHEREGGWHLSPEEYPLEKATPCPAKAGDVLFFSYLTIHGSGLNQSQEPRTTLLIQMRDPLDPPSIRTHESRGQGMMLYGIDPSCCTVRPASEAKEPLPTMGGRM
ncbi:MAG TPA: phytanoyl-CoA dioxygenase family protein [Limnochordia bacterium]